MVVVSGVTRVSLPVTTFRQPAGLRIRRKVADMSGAHKSASLAGQSSQELLWLRANCINSSCVEVAMTDHEVLIRGSGDPNDVVSVSHGEWAAFVKGVRDGLFDLPV